MKSDEYIKPMKIVLRAIIGCVVALMVSQTSIGAAEYDYIDISNPFLRKIPLAVPWFKNISGNQDLEAQSVKLPDLLSDTLEFTGYFKMLDRQAFLMDPKNPDILATHINFRNWTAIGAELLITGGILVKDGLMETELRLFDTIKGKLIIYFDDERILSSFKFDDERILSSPKRICLSVKSILTDKSFKKTLGVETSRIILDSGDTVLSCQVKFKPL